MKLNAIKLQDTKDWYNLNRGDNGCIASGAGLFALNHLIMGLDDYVACWIWDSKDFYFNAYI